MLGKSPRLLLPAALLVLGPIWIFGRELYRVDFSPGNTFHALARMQLGWSDLLDAVLHDPVQWRPLYYIVSKAIQDLAGGSSLAVFVTAHLLALTVFALSFALLATPTRTVDLAALAMAVLALFGMRTFFIFFLVGPVNFYPLVGALLLGVLYVLQRDPPIDLTPVVAFSVTAVALFASELGGLVLVAIVAAYVLRLGKVSRRAVFASVVAAGSYFLLRFATSSAPVPPLFLNDTGLYFRTLEVNELYQRFGDNPYLLYLYNLGATIGSLLLGEPSRGRFDLLSDILRQDPQVFRWINFLVSTLTSALIGLWIVRDREAWRDRWLGLVVMLMLVNCGLGYLYVRDRIICMAGVLLAVLLYRAARYWLGVALELGRDSGLGPRLRQAVIFMMLAALSVGWGIRFAGNVYRIRDLAWETKDDWTAFGADVYAVLPPELYSDPEAIERIKAIPGVDELRLDLMRRVRERELPPRRSYPRWLRPLIETGY